MPNLNAEQHFAQAPLSVNTESSVFDRSTNWKGTFDAGQLVPFLVDEALPGDVYNGKITELIRQTGLIAPVMDNLRADTAVFFVPNRMLWEHWKQFCGENDVSEWTQTTEYTIPTLDCAMTTTVGQNTVQLRKTGDVPHCMGIPLPFNNTGAVYTYAKTMGNYNVNALPFRAYRKIWNEYWRDQNTQAPKLINYGDTETDSSYYDLLPVNRIHDYFGSCLPSTQKGDAVAVALTGFANVFPTSDSSKNLKLLDSDTQSLDSRISSGGILWKNANDGTIAANASIGTASVQNNGNSGSMNGSGYTAARPIPANLIIDGELNADNLGVSIESLRVAIATQRLLETLAVGGSRYIEVIKSLFGITSPDARQQRPELIAWNSEYINTQEVTQTSETGTTPLGTQAAYSKTISDGTTFNYSCTEHGYLIACVCVRHNRSYSQGINKMWYRQSFTDFYNPLFAHLGEMPVYTREIFAGTPSVQGNGTGDQPIFGYQEAWADYRFKPSINCGYLDPSVYLTMGKIWTYGDVYGSAPTLSDSWMQEGNTEVANTQAVHYLDANQSVPAPQFLADIFISLKHQRPMPVYSIPELTAGL